MKKQALILLTALAVTAPAWALRLAYVDVAEVFDQYEGTKAAKDDLKKDTEKKKKELDAQQSDLKNQIDNLQAQKSVLSSAKYKEKEDKLRQQAGQLQEAAAAMQDELMGKEKKKTKGILEEIRGLIREIGQEEKYDYILEKNALLFGGDDITYKVLKRMNSSSKK